MALRTSHTYLALLQQAAYAQIGGVPPTFDPDELRSREALNAEALRDLGPIDRGLEARGLDAPTRRAIIDKWRRGATQVGVHHDLEAVLAAARNAPTPYVNPFHHSILTRLDGRIANLGRHQPQLSFASALQKLHGRVTVSTLPMGQVNARTLSVPGTDEYLIVFDPVFFDFLYDLSIDVAGAIDSGKALEGARRQTTAAEDVDVSPAIRYGHPEVAHRFVSTMFAFLGWGMPPPPEPYDEESFELAEHLRETAMQFILAHEYAHLLLGHLAVPHAPGAEGGAEPSRKFQQELEADWLACSVFDAVLASRGASPGTQFMGPYFFFVAAMFAELGLGAIRTGKTRQLRDLIPRDATELGNTHPVAPLRMARIYEWLETKFPPRMVRANEYLEALLLEVANALWANAQQYVLDMRAKGHQAPVLWKSLDVFECPGLEAPAAGPGPHEAGVLPNHYPPAGSVPRCPRCGRKLDMERYGPQQALHMDFVRDECPECFTLLIVSLADSSVSEG